MTGQLPLLRGERWYESRDTCVVHDGLLLCLAPEIMLRDDARRARAARQAPFTRDERLAVLREAVELFRYGRVFVRGLGDQDPADFATAMRDCAGLPAVLVERWSAMLASCLADLETGEPSKPERPEPDDTALSLISLPANTFTCLESVMEALLHSGAVWIRPSRREPVSSARFLGALLAAGWPAERLGYYPATPSVLPTLIKETDRQVVYGGDTVAGLTGEGLDVRGPGRACLVVDGEAPPDVQVLADLAAGDAGRFCTNICLIAQVGNVGPLARRLADVMDGISLDPPDARRPLASVSETEAERTERFLSGRLLHGGEVLTRRPLVSRAGGRTYLAPTVVQVDSAEHPLVGCELPFPFVVALSSDAASVRRVSSRSSFIYAGPSPDYTKGL